MNKITLLLLFISSILYAQEDTINHSAIKHPKYLENPTEYLSKINHNLIPTQILIDRVLFNDLILKVNGKDKVTTTEYQDFYTIYQSLKLAHNDSSFFVDFDTLINISNAVYDYDKTNIISILDFNFNRVNPQAITNGDFSELNDSLVLNRVNDNNFLTDRAITFSVFKHNIFGDDIKFQVIDFYNVLNTDKRTLQKLEIDFGNGSGFQEIILNETFSVDYYDESRYVELKLKITYLNTETLKEEVYYAHSSVYRKAMSNRSQYATEADISSIKYWVPKPNVDFDFPSKILRWRCIGAPRESDFKCFWDSVHSPYTLDVKILYSSQNLKTQSESGTKKLRKPFIMVDGFDPGNKRDYWTTIKDSEHHLLLPMDRDYRGLYEYLFGGRSPWDETEQSPISGFAESLRNDGYDLIFVNFRDGAGDVNENAKRLRQFLNEVINSSEYRDNKTEEIVLVGPSMGGLITRIALTEMEKANEEHFVKSWISFDSPQTGAYIPISVQALLEGMTKSNIDDIYNQGYPKFFALKSTAAKQMLNMHILSESRFSTCQENKDVYQKLDSLNYPIFSKRYSITNGGKELQYPSDNDYEIGVLRLKATKWGITGIDVTGNRNNKNYMKLVSGFIRKNKFTGGKIDVNLDIPSSHAIEYENAPGGWHHALYSTNKSKDNKINENNHLDQFGDRYNKAAFIPSVSAFGIPINKDNIHHTWENYTNINDFSSGKIRTPFDAIYGMVKNEEHMKISVNTKNDIIEKWLEPDNIVAQRPVVRVGEPIQQTVSKPVAYLVKQEIVFAGNGNTFTLKEGANANIVAGKNIKFSPGFSVKSGAVISAKIQPEQDVILKRSSSQLVVSDNSDYINESPYHQKVFNYEIIDRDNNIKSYIKLQIFPNPVQDFVNLSIEEDYDNLNTLNIHDVNGKLIYSEQIISNQNKLINTQNWARGVYFVTVNGKNNIQKTKIVK